MKVIIAALIFAFCMACGNPLKKNSDNQAAAIENKKEYGFEFEKEIHNFGLLQAGEVVIYNFAFVNTGTRDLEIVVTEADCPCLEVIAGKIRVKSGEKSTIRVTFNTSGLYGSQLQMFRVTAGEGKLSKELVITAEVKNENINFK